MTPPSAAPAQPGPSRPISQLAGPIPLQLANVLRRARATELSTTGASRRHAFRTTRYLLGSAIEIGFDARALADCIQASEGSVRTRATRNGWITTTQLHDLGISAETIQRWRRDGLLADERPAELGEHPYRAADIVTALCQDDRRTT